MKRALMMGATSAMLFAVACGDTKPDLAEDFSDLAAADGKSDTISTKKLKVVGSLAYGQSASAKFDGKTKYDAFKFAGAQGDQIVIDVASKNGDAYAWLTDDLGKVIAKNDDYGTGTDSHIEATLPANKNPKVLTYYIVFTEYFGDPASFLVSLKKKQLCVQSVPCIQGTHWDTNSCKCVSDNQFCGGIAGIRCPASLKCVDNPNDNCDPNKGGADCAGICVLDTTVHCGGIANIRCPGGQQCIDDPNDNCDPNKGGADCGGICVACIQTVLCAAGSHFSHYQCACVSNSCVDTVQCLAGNHWSAQDCTCVPN